MEPDQQVSTGIAHRHFAAINTGWKYVISAPEPPNENHQVDDKILSIMRRDTGG
jgi:hypothetical protein